MIKENKTITINEHTFELIPMKPSQSLTLLTKLFKVVGKSIEGDNVLDKDIASIVKSLAVNIEDVIVFDIINSCLKNIKHKGTGLINIDSNIFVGDLGLLFILIKDYLSYEYESFLDISKSFLK